MTEETLSADAQVVGLQGQVRQLESTQVIRERHPLSSGKTLEEMAKEFDTKYGPDIAASGGLPGISAYGLKILRGLLLDLGYQKIISMDEKNKDFPLQESYVFARLRDMHIEIFCERKLTDTPLVEGFSYGITPSIQSFDYFRSLYKKARSYWGNPRKAWSDLAFYKWELDSRLAIRRALGLVLSGDMLSEALRKEPKDTEAESKAVEAGAERSFRFDG